MPPIYMQDERKMLCSRENTALHIVYEQVQKYLHAYSTIASEISKLNLSSFYHWQTAQQQSIRQGNSKSVQQHRYCSNLLWDASEFQQQKSKVKSTARQFSSSRAWVRNTKRSLETAKHEEFPNNQWTSDSGKYSKATNQAEAIEIDQ